MTRRLSRHALRRAGERSVRRLPGHAIGHPGLARQALIGMGAGLACAGGLAATDGFAACAAGWRDAAGRALIIVPDPARLPAVLALAGPDAHEVPAPSLAAALGPDQAPALITTTRHDPDFAGRLAQAAPGALLEPDGGAPAARLAAFGIGFLRLCDVLLGALGLLAASALAWAARVSTARTGPAARLLSDLGMTPRALHRAIALPLAGAACLGYALGATGAALPLAALQPLSPRLLPILAASAAIAAVVTWLGVVVSLRRQLRTTLP